MKSASPLYLLLSVLLLAGMPASTGRVEAATVALTNGSFEAGTTGRPLGIVSGAKFNDLMVSGATWDIYSAVKGWKTVSGAGVEVQSDRNPATLDAQNGDYYISLDGQSNASIQQKVGLSKGSYILSFWYSPQTTLGPTNTIGYNLGNVVSGRVTSGTNGARVGVWTEVRNRFTVLTRGNYDLTFAALGASDGIGGFIDNVSIEAVPVPAAGLGLLSGLIGLVGLKRRRRA